MRVFENACVHRGSVLAVEPRRCRRNIVCPYHSWAYDLDGTLIRTPHAGGAGKHTPCDFDAKEFSLKEIRSATWKGLVFVNISATESDFADFIGPLDERIGELPADALVRDSPLSSTMCFNANWKLVVENFVESYHVPPVHPELEKVNPMRMHYQILGGHSYLGQGGDSYTAGESEELAGLPRRPGGDTTSYEAFYLLPNLIIGPLPDFTFIIIINPTSPATTSERIEILFYGNAALDDALADQRRSNSDFLTLINSQDIGACEKVQQGRHCPGFNGGVFALPQEATSLQFLRIVAARMCIGKDQTPQELIDLPVRDIRHQEVSRS
ncbi:aromatic ring-hydroxylating dioxygenase subunit alpha [Pseudohaliea sp.]|uniref:aromatic ring-hydroxylating oxygenase subunit alpha n=1 Tax=Pseudohaliea sp. TaxID=2740289 RepID=UPI0032EDD229